MSDEVLEKRVAEMSNGPDIVNPIALGGVNKRTYSVEEIMAILDISRSTAYQLIRKKMFQSVKAGKQIRISKKALMPGWTILNLSRVQIAEK